MNTISIKKIFVLLISIFIVSFNFSFAQSNNVNFTFRINDKAQTSQVNGQEYLDKINPLIDSLNSGIDSLLNLISGWDSLTNMKTTQTNIGQSLNLINNFDITGTNNFIFTINSFTSTINFNCVSAGCDTINVSYSAASIDLKGKIIPDSQNVQNYSVTINIDFLQITQNGLSINIADSIKTRIIDAVRNKIILYFTFNKPFDLVSLLGLFFNDFDQANDISQIVNLLKIPKISTKEIIIRYQINLMTGENELSLNYETPFTGSLINRDTPPIRGLMFSSFNMQVTKQSLGFTGRDLTHYDNVFTDELQFFQLLDSLNIKFIRSDITWSSVEPLLDPINAQNTVNKYILDRTQLFTNLEFHYQYANQFLYDFVVSIGDGHSVPKDPVTNKPTWIGNENTITQEDLALGFTSDNYSFINKATYLAVLERHVRAVVRRLKNVINFWQIENELNQADLDVLTNTQSSFKRNGSAWLHTQFLDDVFHTMANAIKIEDSTARITHNFHPFRISKIQDWKSYLDIIGLTYQPNFQLALPVMGFSIGEMVKIAYDFLGGVSKPVWILSAGYPSLVNGGNVSWDFNKNFKDNFQDINTERQIKWVSDALSNSGSTQAEAFLYRTYQAQNPSGPFNINPSSNVGLIFLDGTPKASHDQIINSLSIKDFSVTISGADTIFIDQLGAFSVNPIGGVVQKINNSENYDFYKWERKDKNSNWFGIDSGAQVININQTGIDDFKLRCTVTDYIGNKQISNEFNVIVNTVVSVESDKTIPKKISLIGNFPNPFNPSTNIKYSLNKEVDVTLKIFNTLGQVVRTLINKTQKAGFYTVFWNGNNDVGQNVSSSVYLYQLIAEHTIHTKKMVLIR
ncbi:MAG: T9SS type A sorting domain-containing protein [Bacteroidetes bacterium]|nr:T9SS type A sorting domain-containing protein [Bacteroidota bacterium]